MKLSKTDYRGGEALCFSTKALELTVTTGLGPRVVSLRSLSGKAGNLFFQFPDDEKRYHGYYLRGGHRLWHSPEHIVRTYQPDDEPLTVRLLPHGAVLTQPVEAQTGMQKAMRFELLGERTVRVTHTLSNRGLWAVEASAWALTMLRGGGYGVIPLMPKGSHESGDLLPNYALVPWTYTDLALPCWNFHRDFLGIDVGRSPHAQKLGLTNYPGWSAYWLNGTTLVKYAPVVSGATYPDLGSALEAFTNGEMIEIETLSPLTKLEPGKSVTHVENWTVFDGLAKPSSDKVFNESLAPAVTKWLKMLK